MDLILNLMGGLGLFLFGMNFMSQAMQKAAGAKLRGILSKMTKNQYVAVLFGAFFTAVIQSSGATTVMVVSFVQAGMMTLAQSVGITFGANIGTTITSQLVAFNLTAIAPMILLVGALMFMFGTKPMTKKIGEVVIGFGALFMGIAMMKDAMIGVQEYPYILDGLAKLSNPLLAILLGLIITVIVQSSSVTVSILLLMAQSGMIDLSVCFYFVLGCNIGSCTPAVLAGMNSKKEARRAALIHLLYNVFGMIIIGALLAVFMEPFRNFILRISGGNVGRCVANADTIYKVFQTVLFFPFANQFIKLTYRLVPGEDAEDESEYALHFINRKKTNPATAVIEAVHEIQRMGMMAIENLHLAVDCLLHDKYDVVEQIKQTETYIDYLNNQITDYLVEVNMQQLPVADSERIAGLFHVVSDIERIGDHAENIMEAALTKREDDLSFTKKALKELTEMDEKVELILQMALDMFVSMSQEHLDEILALENEIDEMERKLQKNHIRRMSKEKCTPKAGMLFTDMVTGLERVGDHATNIAFSILEKDPEEDEDFE